LTICVHGAKQRQRVRGANIQEISVFQVSRQGMAYELLFIFIMKRVLIIDKHSFVRALLARSLQSDDTVIAPYTSIKMALPYLKDYWCHLCFLELKLSDEDALKDLEMLKGSAPETKVIAISGSYVSDTVMRELESNGCLLMRKPFLPSEIRRMTSDALGLEEFCVTESRADDVQKQRERRMSVRMPITRRIDYALGVSGGEEVRKEGDIINISETGMLLLTNYPVSAGNRLRFSFGVEESQGAVVWSRKNEYKHYSAGIVFI
jgi:DNA-binding NarL/FixJ family response regulator